MHSHSAPPRSPATPATAGHAELFGQPPTARKARQRTGVMLQVGQVPETDAARIARAKGWL